MATLHIINGDGTLGGFKATGLTGEVLVWREILCEGPIQNYSDASSFFIDRKKYLEPDKKDPADSFYLQKVQPEIEKLHTVSSFDEIVLWFEYDLFCQVNLWFVLYQIQEKINASKTNVFLICPQSFDEVKDFKGLGQLNEKQLLSLYKDKQQLTEKDLKIGSLIWHAYAQNDPNLLVELYHKNQFEHLDCAANALRAHFFRFPNITSGINQLQQWILNDLKEGQKSEKELIIALLKTDRTYGFGDVQMLQLIHGLHPHLITKKEEKYQLTELGHAVQSGKLNGYTYQTFPQYIGGYILTKNKPFYNPID